MARRWLILIMVMVMMFSCLGPALAAGGKVSAGTLLDEIMEHLDYHHISRPDRDRLLEGALEGVFYMLEDPYTEYLSDEDMKDYTNALDGDYVGVGISLTYGSAYPMVLEVLPDSPAARYGLRANDSILAVNGKDIAGLSLDQVVNQIKGPVGTTVNLTIGRQGVQDFTVAIERAPVHRTTVDYRMLEGGTGYFAIYSFGSRTAEELRQALTLAKNEGLEAVILDLRYNGGGYMEAAVDMASLMLKPDLTVTRVKDREGTVETLVSRGSPVIQDLPVAVIVNEFTASAAEVLAGALQDHKIATLVGANTYGKGTVQVIIPLESGGVLKLTKYKYVTPLGQSIDQYGLKPDVLIKTPEVQLAATLRLLNPQRPQIVKFTNGLREVQLGEEVVFSVASPFITQGLFYVPLRFTLEGMGYELAWQAEHGIVNIRFNDQHLVLDSKRNSLVLEGRQVSLGNPVLVKDGTIFLEARDLKLFGITVSRLENTVILEQ